MTRWLTLFLCLLFVACATAPRAFERPAIFTFGSALVEMQQQLADRCSSVTARMNEPIQLPTARNRQTQLDCEGFVYAGRERKVELVFADDQLDLVWILTEPEEETRFIEAFTRQYGPPTHVLPDATFFLDAGVAVRNDPHEVLFLSGRLREPYRQWLASQVE